MHPYTKKTISAVGRGQCAVISMLCLLAAAAQEALGKCRLEDKVLLQSD